MSSSGTDGELQAGRSPAHGLAHEATVRVRFPEVDSQGVVHHSVYLQYFEVGRTEMLRELGVPYSRLEKEGTLLMVTDCEARFRRPAHYDDVLVVRTQVEEVTRVRIRLSYEVRREEDGEVTCTGRTTLASIDPRGKPCGLAAPLRQKLAGR